MSKAIQDEFTALPISRQRKWQLRQIKRGRCQRCGQQIIKGSKDYCLECMMKMNHHARKKLGHKRHYRSLSWRLQNGT